MIKVEGVFPKALPYPLSKVYYYLCKKSGMWWKYY
jgi:hypothetical protein